MLSGLSVTRQKLRAGFDYTARWPGCEWAASWSRTWSGSERWAFLVQVGSAVKSRLARTYFPNRRFMGVILSAGDGRQQTVAFDFCPSSASSRTLSDT